jgi:hemin uptake protein HemP
VAPAVPPHIQPKPQPTPAAQPPHSPQDCPRYSSSALFGAAQEIHIEHDTQLYRLRRTALGKLILTK